ncbi:MAG: IMP cyclohydrolase [Deltaproteobacteria bacterium]|nr:IMP cyclohydrolase [Deltaproteobacteria bacterium]
MAEDLKKAYRTVMEDHFPGHLEIKFGKGPKAQTLVYEKASWIVDGVEKGLRYGENPGQEAALYKLVNGNLLIGEVHTIKPGRYLASDMALLQAGKHPGKINLTDIDNALNILRYLTKIPSVAIMKHNNPCGVASGSSLEDAYLKAYYADRVAAFGGAIAVNRPLDKATAEAISEQYAEVVAAPEYEEGTIDILSGRKNLRIAKIGNIGRLSEFSTERFVDFKSLIDGGLIAQMSFVPVARHKEDFKPAVVEHKGKTYEIARKPDDNELEDMLFGWLVEAGVTSNSVIYVKDRVTVGIGTGEQDRVGVAKIARDKAYTKLMDKLCFERYKVPFNELADPDGRHEIESEVREQKGGLPGSSMVSDAFFPFRDGVEVGLHEGVRAVVQPGGALRDHEVIEACNEFNATMVFTGQRSFKH